MLATWSIPFPKRRKEKKKKGEHRAGSRKAGGGGTAPPPPRPKPAWDSTTSDLSRFRLGPAEQEFRRSLRQSRHRPQPAASTAGSQEVHLQSEADEPGDLAVPLAGALLRSAAFFPNQAALHSRNSWQAADEAIHGDCAAKEQSLEEMRRFVAELQLKYLAGDSGSSLRDDPVPSASGGSLAHRKLAKLRAEKHAAAGHLEEAERGSDASISSDGDEQRDPPAAAAAPARKPHGSDSEGEGRLGPAALRRAQRRMLHAPQPLVTSAAPSRAASQHSGEAEDAPAQSMQDRLAALEARVERCEGLEEGLRQAQASVAELQEQTAALLAELDSCISHSLHATTQL